MPHDNPFPGFDADTDNEHHAASPTALILDNLALYGYRPGQGEHDPRLLPEPEMAQAQLAEIFDAFGAMLADTCFEEDLPDLLWSVVNLFHRKIDRLERNLDDNEQAQRRSQAEQDGSELMSVELERLLSQGQNLLERRNNFESFRDHAADLFEVTTGSVWRPRAGSVINHRTLAARRRAETELRIPSGPRIAFTGGMDCNDHHRIWAVLDKARAKHPDMVLLHGGSPQGAERIAACWADHHKVAQIVFKPDWTR